MSEASRPKGASAGYQSGLQFHGPWSTGTELTAGSRRNCLTFRPRRLVGGRLDLIECDETAHNRACWSAIAHSWGLNRYLASLYRRARLLTGMIAPARREPGGSAPDPSSSRPKAY